MKSFTKSSRAKFIISVLIVIVFLLCISLSNETVDRINNIENYENVFHSVDELKFFIEGNNFYSTKSPAKDLRVIKKIRINTETLVAEESQNREFKYRITVNDKYIIYIIDDFSQLWLDDKNTINIDYNNGTWDKNVDEGLGASLSYSVENPEVLKNLFLQHSQHITQ